MKKEMKMWQWIIATAVAALSSLGGAMVFATDYVQSKINDGVAMPLQQINQMDKRLDRIENKVDQLLERK